MFSNLCMPVALYMTMSMSVRQAACSKGLQFYGSSSWHLRPPCVAKTWELHHDNCAPAGEVRSNTKQRLPCLKHMHARPCP